MPFDVGAITAKVQIDLSEAKAQVNEAIRMLEDLRKRSNVQIKTTAERLGRDSTRASRQSGLVDQFGQPVSSAATSKRKSELQAVQAEANKTAAAEKKLTEEVKKQAAAVDKSNKSLKEATDDTYGLSVALFRAGLGFAAMGASISVVTAATLKAASAAEETRNLYEVSMGGMRKATDQWVESLHSGLGIGRTDLREMVGTFHVMLQGMDVPVEQAAEMSKALTQLTLDMASFRNLSIDETFVKITSGLSGEVEPLRRLGILINEQTVQRYAYANGIAKEGQELDQVQKVMARYGAIMEKTNLDQGDMMRTKDQLANQQKILKSSTTELAEVWGGAMTEAVKGAATQLNGFVKFTTELISQHPSAAAALSSMVAAFGAVSGALGTAMIAGSQFIQMQKVIQEMGMSKTAGLIRGGTIAGVAVLTGIGVYSAISAAAANIKKEAEEADAALAELDQEFNQNAAAVSSATKQYKAFVSQSDKTALTSKSVTNLVDQATEAWKRMGLQVDETMRKTMLAGGDVTGLLVESGNKQAQELSSKRIIVQRDIDRVTKLLNEELGKAWGRARVKKWWHMGISFDDVLKDEKVVEYRNELERLNKTLAETGSELEKVKKATEEIGKTGAMSEMEKSALFAAQRLAENNAMWTDLKNSFESVPIFDDLNKQIIESQQLIDQLVQRGFAGPQLDEFQNAVTEARMALQQPIPEDHGILLYLSKIKKESYDAQTELEVLKTILYDAPAFGLTEDQYKTIDDRIKSIEDSADKTKKKHREWLDQVRGIKKITEEISEITKGMAEAPDDPYVQALGKALTEQKNREKSMLQNNPSLMAAAKLSGMEVPQEALNKIADLNSYLHELERADAAPEVIRQVRQEMDSLADSIGAAGSFSGDFFQQKVGVTSAQEYGEKLRDLRYALGEVTEGSRQYYEISKQIKDLHLEQSMSGYEMALEEYGVTSERLTRQRLSEMQELLAQAPVGSEDWKNLSAQIGQIEEDLREIPNTEYLLQQYAEQTNEGYQRRLQILNKVLEASREDVLVQQQVTEEIRQMKYEHNAAMAQQMSAGDGFFSGMRDGFEQIQIAQNDYYQKGLEMAQKIDSEMDQMLGSIIDGSKTMSDAMKDAFREIANEFAKMIAKMITNWIMWGSIRGMGMDQGGFGGIMPKLLGEKAMGNLLNPQAAATTASQVFNTARLPYSEPAAGFSGDRFSIAGLPQPSQLPIVEMSDLSVADLAARTPEAGQSILKASLERLATLQMPAPDNIGELPWTNIPNLEMPQFDPNGLRESTRQTMDEAMQLYGQLGDKAGQVFEGMSADSIRELAAMEGQFGQSATGIGQTLDQGIGGSFDQTLTGMLGSVQGFGNAARGLFGGIASGIGGMFGNIFSGGGATFAAFGAAPALATGTTNIPQDGLYNLHQGEAVIPRFEASMLRAGIAPEDQEKRGTGVTIYNLITPEAIAKAMQSREGRDTIINVIDADSLRNGKTRQRSRSER